MLNGIMIPVKRINSIAPASIKSRPTNVLSNRVDFIPGFFEKLIAVVPVVKIRILRFKFITN